MRGEQRKRREAVRQGPRPLREDGYGKCEHGNDARLRLWSAETRRRFLFLRSGYSAASSPIADVADGAK